MYLLMYTHIHKLHTATAYLPNFTNTGYTPAYNPVSVYIHTYRHTNKQTNIHAYIHIYILVGQLTATHASVLCDAVGLLEMGLSH